MADDHEEHFEQASSGASATFPRQCSALRKSDTVMIKHHPCKIVDMSTSKTGKHGHAKVHITGIDIFTGKKYEDICPSTHNMECPNVTRVDYTVLSIDDEYLTLYDESRGSTRCDLKLPEEEPLRSEILHKMSKEETFVVSVLFACSAELVVGVKKMDTSK